MPIYPSPWPEDYLPVPVSRPDDGGERPHACSRRRAGPAQRARVAQRAGAVRRRAFSCGSHPTGTRLPRTRSAKPFLGAGRPGGLVDCGPSVVIPWRAGRRSRHRGDHWKRTSEPGASVRRVCSEPSAFMT